MAVFSRYAGQNDRLLVAKSSAPCWYRIMARPRRFFGLGLALFAMGLLALLASALYRAEPSYGGKRLSNWAHEYGTNMWSNPNKAQTAIRHIGTNGVPFLLQAIAVEPSVTRKKLREMIPQKWHARLHLQDKSGDIRRMGAHGIAALGSNTPPDVIPKLMTMVTNHPDEDGRYIAAFALRTLGPTARPAIPFFVECLKTNNDKFIRDEAAIALGLVESQPEVTVPALIEFLKFALTQGPSTFEARDTIDSLRRIGTNADAALPLLRSLHDHKDEAIRTSARAAVQVINKSGENMRAPEHGRIP